MRLFLQYAASGLATGCAFALVATGFVGPWRASMMAPTMAMGAKGPARAAWAMPDNLIGHSCWIQVGL